MINADGLSIIRVSILIILIPIGFILCLAVLPIILQLSSYILVAALVAALCLAAWEAVYSFVEFVARTVARILSFVDSCCEGLNKWLGLTFFGESEASSILTDSALSLTVFAACVFVSVQEGWHPICTSTMGVSIGEAKQMGEVLRMTGLGPWQYFSSLVDLWSDVAARMPAGSAVRLETCSANAWQAIRLAIKCLLWAGLHGLVQLRGVRGSAKASIYVLLLVGIYLASPLEYQRWLPPFGLLSDDISIRTMVIKCIYFYRLTSEQRLLYGSVLGLLLMTRPLPAKVSPFQPTSFEQNTDILRALEKCALLAALLIGLSAAAGAKCRSKRRYTQKMHGRARESGIDDLLRKADITSNKHVAAAQQWLEKQEGSAYDLIRADVGNHTAFVSAIGLGALAQQRLTLKLSELRTRAQEEDRGATAALRSRRRSASPARRGRR